MEQYKQEFINFMVESEVLKFGEFTLKSGRKSPFFMNAGAYVTGTQLRSLETFPILKSQADVEIKGLMVSLNRMERGKGEKCALDEIKELYGFPTAAIVSMSDVVECLYNKECQGKVVIDDTLKAAIDAYYEQYGAK